MFEHNTLPVLIALQFSLSASNLQISVLCLPSNISLNRRGDFLALGFLVDTDGLGVIRLLYVHSLVVETISDSRIALFCC